jgi:hypothetical protein
LLAFGRSETSKESKFSCSSSKRPNYLPDDGAWRLGSKGGSASAGDPSRQVRGDSTRDFGPTVASDRFSCLDNPNAESGKSNLCIKVACQGRYPSVLIGWHHRTEMGTSRTRSLTNFKAYAGDDGYTRSQGVERCHGFETNLQRCAWTPNLSLTSVHPGYASVLRPHIPRKELKKVEEMRREQMQSASDVGGIDRTWR